MNPVRIFTKQGCGHSARAKRLLDSYGVDYEEVDITGHPEARAVMIQASDGADTTPQVFIDGQHIGGADELEQLEREGRLGTALGENPAPPQFI